MKRRWIALMIVATLAVGLIPAQAAAHGGDDEWPKPVYLSLGDSLAAGSLADRNGNTTDASNKAYTNKLYRWMRWQVDRDLRHEKLGCREETVATFRSGDGPYCQDRPASQYDMAMAVLTNPNKDVKVVTINLGANDLFRHQDGCYAMAAAGTILPEEVPGCILGGLEGIAVEVATVVAELRAAAGPDVPFVAMNYYNPQVAALAGYVSGVPGPVSSDPLSDPDLVRLAGFSTAVLYLFGEALEEALGTVGVPVVDVFSAFHAGDMNAAYLPPLPPEMLPQVDPALVDNWPRNGQDDAADFACRLTSMCPAREGKIANIHPTRVGYWVIARTFIREALRDL